MGVTLKLWRPIVAKWGRQGLILIVIGLVVVLAGGGAVLAQLGGAPKQSASTDINLQKGLVGWWDFNGNAKDKSPYADNATVTGASLAADVKGRTNSAYSLDGTSNFINATTSSAQNTGSFTASFWFTQNVATLDCDANNNWRSLIRQGGTASSASGWDVVMEQNSGVQFDLGLNGTSSRSGGITVGIAQNVPVYLTFTYDATTGIRYIYANAVQKETKTDTPGVGVTPSGTLDIGHGSNAVACPNGAGYSPGVYDDVRVYNRALSAAEVTALYGGYDSSAKTGQGENGLVGWWKMDGNAKDSSPNANNGTISGVTLTSDREGANSSAYTFNGTNAYIDLPSSAILNSSVFSMSAWVYPTAESTQQNTIIGSSASSGPQLRINTAGKLNLLKENVVSMATSSGTVPLNTWTHVGVTYDASGNYTFYINGQPSGSGTNLQTFTFSNYRLGKQTAAEFFTGSMDDIRIYNRVLSASDFASQYKSYNSQLALGGSPGSTVQLGRGLVGDWPFNGNAKDITPYGDNGTITGATLAADRKNRANSAYLLGNSNAYINVGSPSTFGTLTTTGFTYSIWLMRTAASTYQWPEIMGAGNTHLYYGIRSLSFGDSINFEYGTSPFTGTSFTSMTSKSLPVNQWHMITITYNGTVLNEYWDGAFVANATVALNPTFGGLNFSSASSDWNGTMDDARVWNRALNASEISAIYNEYR